MPILVAVAALTLAAAPEVAPSTQQAACSRLDLNFAERGVTWGLAEETENGHPVLYVGESHIMSGTICGSDSDLAALGGRDAITRTEFAFVGPSGTFPLPSTPSETSARTVRRVCFYTEMTVAALPPPGVYDVRAHVPGCDAVKVSQARGPYRVKDPTTPREIGCLHMRRMYFDMVTKDFKEMRADLEALLASPQPAATTFKVANFNMPILRDHGMWEIPPKGYCERAKDVFDSAEAERRPQLKDLLAACADFQRTGRWTYPTPGIGPTPPALPAPKDYVGLVTSGDQAFARNDLESAEGAYRGALRIEPKGPEANFGLAHVLRVRDPKQAIPFFRAGLEAKPDDPQSRLFLADTLAAAGRRDDAVEQYKEIIVRDGPRSDSGMSPSAREAFGSLKLMGVSVDRYELQPWLHDAREKEKEAYRKQLDRIRNDNEGRP